MKEHAVTYQATALLFSFLIMLTLSGCWFSSDQNETGAQLKAECEETIEPASRTADSPRENIVFEEPHLLPEAAEADHNAQKESPPSPGPDKRPKVAIIIDDMGYHRKIGDQLLAQEINLSFSFLPMAPFAGQQEEKAYELGRDIMVHMPMEASDGKWDPGPGALYLSASPAQLTATLKKNLAAVPYAVGANNHMGSKFTENQQAMQTVLVELKEQGLFFVDSYTTAKSTGMNEAKKMGIKTGRRHIFLDNIQDPEKICIQLDKLAAVAGKQNYAIGIGHPYQATLDALRSCGGKLLETVQVVPVHELVE